MLVTPTFAVLPADDRYIDAGYSLDPRPSGKIYLYAAAIASEDEKSITSRSALLHSFYWFIVPVDQLFGVGVFPASIRLVLSR